MRFRSALRQYQREYQREYQRGVFSIQFQQWQQCQQGYPLAIGDIDVFCGSSCNSYGNYNNTDCHRVNYNSTDYDRVNYNSTDCDRVDYGRVDYSRVDYFGTTSQRSQQP